eukprot:5385416-Amphidinium_carterae.1
MSWDKNAEKTKKQQDTGMFLETFHMWAAIWVNGVQARLSTEASQAPESTAQLPPSVVTQLYTASDMSCLQLSSRTDRKQRS